MIKILQWIILVAFPSLCIYLSWRIFFKGEYCQTPACNVFFLIGMVIATAVVGIFTIAMCVMLIKSVVDYSVDKWWPTADRSRINLIAQACIFFPPGLFVLSHCGSNQQLGLIYWMMSS